MKVLNNTTCKLNSNLIKIKWIPNGYNWREIRHKLVHKVLKLFYHLHHSWLWFWEQNNLKQKIKISKDTFSIPSKADSKSISIILVGQNNNLNLNLSTLYQLSNVTIVTKIIIILSVASLPKRRGSKVKKSPPLFFSPLFLICFHIVSSQ